MDFVKELGLTVLAGAFAMLGIEVIAYFFLNKRPFTLLAHKLSSEVNEISGSDADPGQSTGRRTGKGEKDQTFTVVVFVLIAFAAGILLEDLSLKYLDSEPYYVKTIPAWCVGNSYADRFALPMTTDDRVLALVGDFKYPTPLGRDLAENHAFEIHNGSKVDLKVQQWIENELHGKPEDDPGQAAIQTSIVNLYFIAKNTAYAHPQHYDELRRIQARYEFATSLSLLSFAYLVLALGVGAFLLVKRFLNRKKAKKPDVRLRELHSKVPFVLAALLVVYLLSLAAVAREANAFNKRVFGYLSTTLITTQRLPQSPSPTPTPTPTPIRTPTPFGTP